jgi:NhaP-type Na+/H+ or K+/H+ antiporter
VTFWLFAVAGVFVVYALFSRRLSTTAITGPIVFVTVGLIVGSPGLDILETTPDSEAVTTLLEITLAIVLFSDANAINSTAWRQEAFVPGRLLLVGMPLTIVFGLAAAVALFTDLGIWEAALIAAILAPTDASLGQAVISNPRVPQRIRQGLNVESGLNDGVVLPLVLIFLGAAEESATSSSVGDVLSFIGQEILIAAVIGISFGWLGAKAILASTRRGWISKMWTQIGGLALAAAAYGLAVPLDGSGFIAAWLTGLTLGALTRGDVDELTEFSETLGSALTSLSFLVFGALLLGPAIGDLTWQVALYSVLSLTLIRMIPVAVAMVGSGLGRPSVLYLGWFGPRGLASIIFAGIVIEDADLPGASTIITVVMVTVGLSVFAHGATSWSGSESYGNWYHTTEQADPDIPEAAERPQSPLPGRLDAPPT